MDHSFSNVFMTNKTLSITENHHGSTEPKWAHALFSSSSDEPAQYFPESLEFFLFFFYKSFSSNARDTNELIVRAVSAS